MILGKTWGLQIRLGTLEFSFAVVIPLVEGPWGDDLPQSASVSLFVK